MPDPSFDEFVATSLPALNRYAYGLTGGIHASEDLVQDTLVKLAGAWRRVRSDGNPIGYARTVMFRMYVGWWRTRRRRPVEAPYQETCSQADAYAGVDAWDELRRALGELPTLQRATLVLTYLDDLPDDEIADLLQRRPATIRSLRHRGLNTLREHLNGTERAEDIHAQR